MQRRHLLQLSALGLMPASLSLASSALAQAGNTIQFGCPVPMSGPFAANGKFADIGMKLAIEQYGKALDMPLAYTLLDTEGKPAFMEKFVLSEIAGKKAAIHAYDGIVWKIRSGFLTLTFGGWAIMLQSLAGRDQAPHDYKPLVWGLYLFSLGFTLGAWFVDRSYIQRKFRVIIALDRLTEVLTARGGDCSGIPADLLIIAGDNAIKPYDCAGYRNALKAESVVYLAPLTVIFAVVFWLL